jgi:hypothetical protein
MRDYAIISMHEKGFWQVDVYWKLEEPPTEDDSPDHFKTFKVGDGVQVAKRWCEQWCLGAEVTISPADREGK